MSLSEYKRKRHFDRTSEPVGQPARTSGRSFVVQKHHASHLHYDFRLELDGVLKSWAVPKGPSLDPVVKRLAMQVEDHPVDYGSFEGVIPAGEYGGGTVMLWDRGTWEPIGDPNEGFRTGRLKFHLHGEKLRGGWMLVRTGKSSESEKDRRHWLLFKERDDEAAPAADGDVLEQQPESVSTGRSLDEIASDKDWVWGATAETKAKTAKRSATPKRRPGRTRRVAFGVAKVVGAEPGKLPAKVAVELAALATEAPYGDEWFHEIKFDGYRMICRIDKGRVRFTTRNHNDWTERLSSLADAARELPVTRAILDGEVVALRADGITDFQELQNAFRDQRAEGLIYYVFDLLHLDGYDLTNAPLEERKRILADVLSGGVAPNIRLSEHVEGEGAAFLKQACAMRLEGIISKRRDRPYRGGRGRDWLKIKCVQKDEFVIGGYTEPTGSRVGFGALLLGYHNQKGDLIYAGRVGTGFDDRTLHDLMKRLQPLERKQSPFSDLKRDGRTTHWVQPKLVAQVGFGAWTRDGILRHASFQGLREDKAASAVTHDKAAPANAVAPKNAKGKAAPPPRDESSNGSVRHRKKKKPAAPKVAKIEYDARSLQYAGIRLTSPNKVLYPDAGITKLELARYYRAVADWMLPHIADRPLVLVRCPAGCAKECFYQKHPGMGMPETLRQIPVRESQKNVHYVVADDVAGLISLAQVSALEVHAWGARADKLERPDRLIFDLDPDPSVPWAQVVQSARQVRKFLQELGLESFVKTTGGKGLHLVAPIDRRHDWDEAKAFCKQVADVIVALDPLHYTANMSKAARPGKIFIDYLRNGRGSTAIVPYSPRARGVAPVSTPLTWNELSARTHSDHYTVRNVLMRLELLKRDPWDGIASLRQTLAAAMEKLRVLS